VAIDVAEMCSILFPRMSTCDGPERIPRRPAHCQQNFLQSRLQADVELRAHT
jgi:hypothetical protein